MRIALTHNLKMSSAPEEAEFDSPQTIDALLASLERLGHEAFRVEVTGPASRLITRLEALSPDLVFNTAEGHKGRTREAFYPALFDELGFPHTGSGAYALCVTLDKLLTKRVLASYGVPTPRARLVTRETLSGGALDDLVFPVIVKPNFEGSSRGIGPDSVCEDPAELAELVERELGRFEAGLIVERFVRGVDLACTFLEGLSDPILEPVEYVIDPAVRSAHNVYDYRLKNLAPERVSQRTSTLGPDVDRRVRELTARIVRALDLKDHARCEFRVFQAPGKPAEIHFLEVDAVPTLDPSAGVFVAAKKRGLGFDDVVRAIVSSACRRRGLDPSAGSARKRSRTLRVGLAHNVKRGGNGDAEAEFDSPRTIAAIQTAIESAGHAVVLLEANPDLPRALTASGCDVVFNIAEGFRGRNRESQVPALCELLGVPYSGSDPTTLSICLDKGLTKQLLRAAGIDTPSWQVLVTGKEKLKPFRYPVIVKPNAEGTSKGITQASVVADEAQARAAARALIDRYGQPALVEEYVAGREFTVGLLGERRPRVLPAMEVVFVDPPEHPVYGYEEKQSDTPRVRFECPARLTPAEQRRVEKVARDTFVALGCRDVARVDLRMAKDGRVFVIEVNPLPGLTPEFSDLCTIAKVAGMDHPTLIQEILSGCVKRFRDAREQKAQAPRLSAPAKFPAAEPSAPAGTAEAGEAEKAGPT